MRRSLVGCAIYFFITGSAFAQQTYERCLPAGITARTVVSAEGVQTDVGHNVVKKVTVGDRLRSLKARCHKGKLVDARGREITFYWLHGCWGNPPANYQEILARQREEIEKLQKRYTVITLTCNPDGIMIQ